MELHNYTKKIRKFLNHTKEIDGYTKGNKLTELKLKNQSI